MEKDNPSKTNDSTAVKEAVKRPIIIPKHGKKSKKKDRYIPPTYPDEREDFDFLFDGSFGNFIQKRIENKDELPPLNPEFFVPYDETQHSTELNKYLKFDDNVPDEVQEKVTAIVKKYWSCFREGGLTIPIVGYEMVIDTGASPPVNCKKLHYGVHESPIMQKTIDALRKTGFIIEDKISPWNSNIVLAPKPHQEHITEIDDFIWRFCISYVALNLVTLIISYPIPRCDDAVMNEFGTAKYFILIDAYSGYHQIAMATCSIDKTAFSGPGGRKYKWKVLPFGLRNGPAVFTAMMYDIKEVWDKIISEKIDLSRDNGTRIIIDDLFIFAESLENALFMLEVICDVAQHYCATWKLKKTHFFANKIEFVGVDVSVQGNQPASSKATTLRTWKEPTTVRDIASFLGFVGFYARWIPNFELKALPLRKIIREHNYPDKLTTTMYGKLEKDTFEYLREAVLEYPILIRANPAKRFYLKTDFSALGMGYVLCQPDDSAEALEAMQAEDAGGKCQFDLCLSKLRLHPVLFGSRKCLNNERYFHSFVGEARAAAWAITKNRHFLWARPFTLLTDCNALVWLMTYKGNNAAIRRLLLEMTGYWFTIEHRPNKMMADPDYWSRLDSDHEINPLMKDYILHFRDLWKDFPPAQGDVNKSNSPGRKQNDNSSSQPTIASLAHLASTPANHIYSNVPVSYIQDSENSISILNNNQIVQNQYAITRVNWAVYGFSSGHFVNSIHVKNFPFDISFCADPNPAGRDLFSQFGAKYIFKSLHDMHKAISDSDDSVDAIFITCPLLINPEHQNQFISESAQLIKMCRNSGHLKLVIIESGSHFQTSAIEGLALKYQHKHKWRASVSSIKFTDFNDKIDGNSKITIIFNSNLISPSHKFDLSITRPPSVSTAMFEALHSQFNKREYSVSSFPTNYNQAFEVFQGVKIQNVHEVKTQSRAIARIHHVNDDIDKMPTLQGTLVYDTYFPAPPLGEKNSNIFGELFGILYKDESGLLHTRRISIFEYCRCFGLQNEVLHKVAENNRNLELLRNSLPACTSSFLLEKAFELLRLVISDHENFAIEQHPDIAPAAISNVLTNSIVHHKIPDDDVWRKAVQDDSECKLMLQMIQNPAIITQENLNKLHYTLRQPMRNSNIFEKNGIIFIKEKIPSKNISVALKIVPASLRNIIFIAFHSNPIGGHLSAYHTVHRIRLRFYWPLMVKYIQQMIKRCPGCKMANSTINSKQNYIYSFPIDAPFRTIHIDIYTLGKTASFDGDTALFIVLDHMTSFAVVEPVKELNSKTFSKALMRVLLTHGICHTVIVDADSKFKATFSEVTDLLNLNKHELAKGNHKAMLVERFNRYLNKVLRIFSNERASNRTYVEGALLAAYAWNSAPISGTDISKSLLVMGREFNFPIDFATDKTFSTNNEPEVIFEYTKELVDILKESREIYRILIDEHRAMHREIKNSQIQVERKFKVGDIVLARKQVQSNKAKGKVDKSQYASSGPWIVILDYGNGTYLLQHHKNKNKTEKRHASMIDLCPSYFLPQKPLAGTDNSYSEINKEIRHDRFKSAGISERPATSEAHLQQVFTPDFRVLANDIAVSLPPFPTLQELDNELENSSDVNVQSNTNIESEGEIHSNSPASPRNILETEPEPPQLQHQLSILVPNIIASSDRLFFISHAYDGQRRKEWKIVKLDLKATMEMNPQALTNGKFLVNFLVRHPNDRSYRATQQRYWPSYHDRHIPMEEHSSSIKFIRPAPEAAAFAKHNNLVQARAWIQLNDPSVFIHGPFEFAIVNGRKSIDKIAEKDWKVLKSNSAKYSDDAPSLARENLMSFTLFSPFFETIKK